jgi:hypothetical protein
MLTAWEQILKFTDNIVSDDAGEREYDYSGYLSFGEVSTALARELAVIGELSSAVDVYPTGVEVRYTGRDTNRKNVRLLLQLAELIRSAEGEVRCQVSGEGNQMWFEFYQIKDGRLLRQRGDVVRQPAQEVTALTLDGG